METGIISASTHAQSLKDRFKGIDIPLYKLRKWFSTKHQVFFDCESENKVFCLEKLLKQKDFEAFIIFFVVKQPSGAFKLMDATFKNIGNETIEHFVNRFHKYLESMTRLGVQTVGSEYVEYIGHSYQETESGA